MLIRTYKYKLYKSKKLKHLHNTIDISGIIYNHCIALHKRYYRIYGKYLNKFQLQKHITKLKKQDKHSFWKQVPSQSIQNIPERIDNAYKRFFNYVKGNTKQKAGPPSFKTVKKYKSFTLKGTQGYKIKDNILIFKKHNYKFSKSREIEGTIKTVTIKRDNLGDFYIYIVVGIEETKSNITTGKSVGIDFGMKTFLTLSDKTEVDSPLFHLKYLKKLKKLNRSLSRKKKGSNNKNRAKLKLAKLHKKIANSREDYFHKLTTKLASNYDNIFIEDLNIKAMQKLWGRKISDLAFSKFVNILEYKTNVVKVDRFYPSSKTCSNCGFILEKLDLQTREWDCPSCRTHHQRDINAAINIKRVGASTLRGETVRTT